MGLRNHTILTTNACLFITTTCRDFIPLIQYSNSYSILEDSLSFVCSKYNSLIFGYVIMPNHLHLILYFKEKNEISALMRDFKKFTSVKIRQNLDSIGKSKLIERIRSEKDQRVFQVWNDNFDDQIIDSKEMCEVKLEYIHNNPLQEKWQLVKYPAEYRYSSACFYEKQIQQGLFVTHYMDYL